MTFKINFTITPDKGQTNCAIKSFCDFYECTKIPWNKISYNIENESVSYHHLKIYGIIFKFIQASCKYQENRIVSI